MADPEDAQPGNGAEPNVADLEQRIRDRTAELTAATRRLALAAKVFDAAAEAILITAPDGRILSVNPAFAAMTGWSEADVVGQSPRVLRSGVHGPEFYEQLWRALEAEGRWAGEVWHRRKDGAVFPGWLSISAVREEQGQPTEYVALLSDLTERKRVEAQVDFMSCHDPLTGLLNRQAARRQVSATLTPTREPGVAGVALLLVDVDNFKLVNDALGHAFGDVVLQVLAARLRDAAPPGCSVTRHGGDEFLMVDYSGCGPAGAAQLAERALELVRVPIDVEDVCVHVTASIGVAAFPADGADFDTLLRRAELALYAAKDAGRDTVRSFGSLQEEDGPWRLQVARLLTGAEERGELAVHYQPQVDLRTGAVVGAEALVRWTSPELGPVSPMRFIPIAEQQGLIIRIDRWVLEQASRLAAGLPPGPGGPVVMAVNLSAIQFRRPELEAVVRATVHAAGVDPARIELELTESVLLQHPERVLEVVERLKEQGFRLAIDDFGTGYSSLAYLQRLPADKLKIDRSFVRGLGTDPRLAAIPRAVVRMGHSLGLRVLAEGVEDAPTRDALRRLRCDEAQGFLFHRPMPAEALLALFAGERHLPPPPGRRPAFPRSP